MTTELLQTGPIILLGFMGCGKTTAGEALARRLRRAFVDLDGRIAAANRMTIAEIIDGRGEPAFRELETAELRRSLVEAQSTPMVLALGGGAFAQARNVGFIEGAGARTVWLDAPEEALYARCRQGGDERPLARDRERFGKLYRDRLPFYERAWLRVDASATPENVVEQIVAGLETLPARGSA